MAFIPLQDLWFLMVKMPRGKKPFAVNNVRSVISKGNEAMHTFMTVMNMPPPLSHQSYNYINLSLYNIYEKAAKESMLAGLNDLKEKGNVSTDEPVDTDIGIDESWQKRGHSSLNGIVTSVARENKKVIDYKVYSKFCKSCTLWESKKGTEEYIVWKEDHGRDCEINLFQSSGAMESAGAQS